MCRQTDRLCKYAWVYEVKIMTYWEFFVLRLFPFTLLLRGFIRCLDDVTALNTHTNTRMTDYTSGLGVKHLSALCREQKSNEHYITPHGHFSAALQSSSVQCIQVHCQCSHMSITTYTPSNPAQYTVYRIDMNLSVHPISPALWVPLFTICPSLYLKLSVSWFWCTLNFHT